MFHKYNSMTNTLSAADQLSSYRPEGLGTKEAVNNFYSVIQPKGPFAARAATSPLPSGQSSAKNLLADKALANSTAAKAHSTVAAHGHHAHPAPWEGVNLWRTPFKGDTDTVTRVKKNLSVLDQYVENRTRRIQQLQILALRNKSIPTWVMMPRDKILLAIQGAIGVYVISQVASTVYQHLKAKDRIKLLKLLYKDNCN